jgi:DNA-binding PadR family transcriptional regulator
MKTLKTNTKTLGGNDATTAILGSFELLVMLAVVDVRPNAYGVTIQRAVERRTGRFVSLGAVYVTLDRLEKKQLVTTWSGEPTAERGGRSKRLVALTPRGEDSLDHSLQAMRKSVLEPAMA